MWVLGFWWILIGILNQFNALSTAMSTSWTQFLMNELMAFLAMVFSLLLAFYAEYRTIVLKRASILYDLQAQEHLGLMSSLGSAERFLSCPWVRADIVTNLNFDSSELLKRLKSTHIIASAGVVQMIGQMRTDHPLHALAMLNCLNLMAQNPLCPAYHGLEMVNDYIDKEGQNPFSLVHGNTSLLEHAMQVCMHGVELVQNFDYQGIRGEYNKIAKRDPSFQLSVTDPMIPLVCLAHDIGKLITFERTQAGKVIRVQGLHGQVGAWALAQSSFIKALPMQDQGALLKVLNFYHHPLDFTLDREAKIESDRQAALMMLLIKADHLTSTNERRLASQKRGAST